MAIKLDVKEYCSNCYDFEPDVTKPERTTLYTGSEVIHQSDTIVRCRYANRCANLIRYLTRQNKEDK